MMKPRERATKLKGQTGSSHLRGSLSLTLKAPYSSIALTRCVCINSHLRNFTDIATREFSLTLVDRVAEQAYQGAREANVTLPPLVELGLEFIKEGRDSETWGYYFVDCASRVVFWFEDNESCCLMNYMRGVEHISHVGQCLPCHTTYSIFSHGVAHRVCNRIAVLVRTTSVVRLCLRLSK